MRGDEQEQAQQSQVERPQTHQSRMQGKPQTESRQQQQRQQARPQTGSQQQCQQPQPRVESQQWRQQSQQREDAPSVARRREREMRTISQMVALFCAAHHGSAERLERAHCGERVCSECAQLDAYAVMRTRRCRKMDVKTSCDECENHCYRSRSSAR